METYTLRRGHRSFSSGTRVNVLSENQDGSIQVEVLAEPNPDQYEDAIFDCDWSDLVKHRSKTDYVPEINRAGRRKFLNKLFDGNG